MIQEQSSCTQVITVAPAAAFSGTCSAAYSGTCSAPPVRKLRVRHYKSEPGYYTASLSKITCRPQGARCPNRHARRAALSTARLPQPPPALNVIADISTTGLCHGRRLPASFTVILKRLYRFCRALRQENRSRVLSVIPAT